MSIKSILSAAALVAASFTAPAHAVVNLVQNGNFDSVTAANDHNAHYLADGTANLAKDATYIDNWTVRQAVVGSTPQAWWYPTGAADVTRTTAYANYPGHNWNSGWSIWGPHNTVPVANGYVASPDGGGLVEIDGGADYRASIEQVITGLVVGHTYDVTFDWSGAQQSCCNGPTTEQLAVSLGSVTQTTTLWNNPYQHFSGWFHQTFSFTAVSSSEVLNFLAVGTPTGKPPVILLDSVSMIDTTAATVPEPATWALMLGGFGLAGFAVRRRRAALSA